MDLKTAHWQSLTGRQLGVFGATSLSFSYFLEQNYVSGVVFPPLLAYLSPLAAFDFAHSFSRAAALRYAIGSPDPYTVPFFAACFKSFSFPSRSGVQVCVSDLQIDGLLSAVSI